MDVSACDDEGMEKKSKATPTSHKKLLQKISSNDEVVQNFRFLECFVDTVFVYPILRQAPRGNSYNENAVKQQSSLPKQATKGHESRVKSQDSRRFLQKQTAIVFSHQSGRNQSLIDSGLID